MLSNHFTGWKFFLVVLLVPGGLLGQWVEESYELQGGWNAIYVHADLSHVSLDRLVGSDGGNPIEEIWMWVPSGPGFGMVDTVATAQQGSTEWLKWKRGAGEETTLRRLVGGVACLVRVAASAESFNWTVKGRALGPVRSEWTPSGLNFMGFPTARENAPSWGDFLGLGEPFVDPVEIFRYVGGPMDGGNPEKMASSLYRALPVERNQAYWIRSDDFNRRFGPFEVELSDGEGIAFGEERGQYRFWLRNRSEEAQTVRGELVSSLAAPAGEPMIAGQVPLLVRGEQDMTDLDYPFIRLGETDAEWVLAAEGEPGWEVEVVVGVDRSRMSGAEGSFHAGILRLRDDGGFYEVDLPVTAETGARSGLWVGQAIVGEVAQYLVDYSIGDDGEPLQNDDGSYRVDGVDESFGPVARPFPLRLLVHESGEGQARLLQRIYYGADRGGRTILAHTEGSLDPGQLEEARRLSAAHLPWSEGNTSWTFDGSLVGGDAITASVEVAYDDDRSNPFVHTYHPDHDNYDARFESTLPRGQESYDILREITLQVQPPGDDFSSVTSGGDTLSGRYEEILIVRGRLTDSGSDARTFRTRGGFALNRITDITEVAD